MAPSHPPAGPARRIPFIFALCVALAPHPGRALSSLRDLTSDFPAGAFCLARSGATADLYVDGKDFPGVIRAANDLKSDLFSVTGGAAAVRQDPRHLGDRVVIIGTIGKCGVIDDLIRNGRIDASPIAGKWESFIIQTVRDPLPGVSQGLVIAGSDKRGTIYGVYEMSEQIGVSPWAWWADVPAAHRDAIYVKEGRHVQGEPAVRYRGIFLNDEAPALSGWAKEKFGGLNHRFYEKVFELLLRLRANYLWPAMWDNAFNEDDPLNPKLADEYGIVMGTSHHEPMLRAQQEWKRHGSGPWNYVTNSATLREFWDEGIQRNCAYESIVTLGMRGDGDMPMSEAANTALLERIVADQRAILAKRINPDLAAVPQLWALYKEVQEYYEKGMRVPDDITLLWCDDNWGNLRRLPTPEERGRRGGAGIYYHVDYVGGPRNYKWLNTVPLTKIWEQMDRAWRCGADRIWIVNVGDLKPMELPIDFFLTFARDPASLPYERLGEFTTAWAAQQFGGPAHATAIAALLEGYTKLNSLRKPEMIAPDTFSLVNYREAERVLAEWRDLAARAEALNSAIGREYRPAFFELVIYPIEACASLQEVYLAAGLNRLYARQGRASANQQAERARRLFAEEGRWGAAYHAVNGGKWSHMMDQVKFGYTTWQQPELEVMPAVSEVRPRPWASMAIAIEGTETSWPSYEAGRAVLPLLDSLQRGSRWIEVFNRGAAPLTFQATADQPWVKLTPPQGNIGADVRIEASVDWDHAPAGESAAVITVAGSTGEKLSVHLPVRKPSFPAAGGPAFVETNGCIAIEAPHFARATGGSGIAWKTLPDFGRTLGGVAAYPADATPCQPGGNSPSLEYDIEFLSAGDVSVELHCAPSLDFHPAKPLKLAVSFDDAPPQMVAIGTVPMGKEWERAVGDGVRRVVTSHKILQPGRHVLRLWYVTPGVVIERIIIDAGGMRPSYLGPPESPRIGGAAPDRH